MHVQYSADNYTEYRTLVVTTPKLFTNTLKVTKQWQKHKI